MRTASPSNLTPVTRRPRSQWTIPAINEYERLKEQRAREARLALQFRGTTPYGREIFRRMLHRAWTLCEENRPDATSQLEAELADFPELREEFLRLTGRLDQEPSEALWKELEEQSRDCTLTGVAVRLVLRSRVLQMYNQQLATQRDAESGQLKS